MAANLLLGVATGDGRQPPPPVHVPRVHAVALWPCHVAGFTASALGGGTAGFDSDALTCEGREIPGESLVLFRTDSGDALERHNPNEGTAVVSPPSLVDSSGENHALVHKADDSGVVTFLKAPL
uniref:Uncharacterized protein n=1 Tax=Oryza nivara TaxID=4536 RepID=A0A0E0GPG6_ORYNI